MRARLTTLLSRVSFACLLAAAIVRPADAAELATQKNSGGGVTVAVTPQNTARNAKTWDFKVVLDTHSQELNDDLVKSSVLVDASGIQHAPIAWDGAAAGGHHRAGVLRFRPLAGEARQIELQIRRAGEPAARTFRWQLN